MPINIIKINDLEISGIQCYRTLRRPHDHLKSGMFVAEGEKVVRRLLVSPLTIVSLLLTPEWYSEIEKEIPYGERPIDIYIAEKYLLETIVGCNLHQGIMAMANVPGNKSIEEVVPSLHPETLLVALEGLVNAENVGVIVRNCAALGVDGIVVGETSSSPYLRRAVRNSMGAIFHLPIIHVNSLTTTLAKLRDAYRYSVIGAHPAGSETIYNTDLSGNVCIVLGNEGNGLTEATLGICTTTVSIPMRNDVDSLNVASASAVLLYEVSRQRHTKMPG